MVAPGQSPGAASTGGSLPRPAACTATLDTAASSDATDQLPGQADRHMKLEVVRGGRDCPGNGRSTTPRPNIAAHASTPRSPSAARTAPASDQVRAVQNLPDITEGVDHRVNLGVNQQARPRGGGSVQLSFRPGALRVCVVDRVDKRNGINPGLDRRTRPLSFGTIRPTGRRASGVATGNGIADRGRIHRIHVPGGRHRDSVRGLEVAPKSPAR